MDGFVQWMEKHFMPKASVIAAQRHLVAIRDAFVVTMPLMILGALADRKSTRLNSSHCC